MEKYMSSATDAEIHRYTNGMCHVFAIAMHRLYGAGLYAVTIPEDPVWIDDGDDDNFIPGVAHVFATLNGMAYDIETVIPEAGIISYCETRFDLDELAEETFDSESGLSVYVSEEHADKENEEADEEDDEDEDDEDDDENLPVRPLLSYTQADIDEAMAVARRIYAGRLPEVASADNGASIV